MNQEHNKLLVKLRECGLKTVSLNISVLMICTLVKEESIPSESTGVYQIVKKIPCCINNRHRTTTPAAHAAAYS